MTEQKKLVPKRRFKEYQNTGAWEQREVVDIAPLQRGFDLPKEKMKDGEYPVVMSNGINGYHSEFKATAPGVVTGRSGTIGKLHYIEENFWPHNTSLWVTDFKGNIPLYVYYMFQLLDLSQYGTGSGVPTLNRNDVHDAKIYIPRPEEQNHISDFFRCLDHLITLHQRKLEKAKALKSAYLSEMFPAEGEREPRRRFAGFTDAWRQRKLNEITLKIGSGKTPKGGESSYVLEGIPLLRSQNIYNDLVDLNDVAYITSQTDEEMKNSRVVMNDILLNITGASIGRSAVYRFSSRANVNQHVCIVRPVEGYSSDFIQLNLTSPEGQQQINNNQAGGGREGLNFQQIGKISFMFPSVQEQFQIGSFFRNFDHLITLHQRKLEKLQSIKKAYLNEMFV